MVQVAIWQCLSKCEEGIHLDPEILIIEIYPSETHMYAQGFYSIVQHSSFQTQDTRNAILSPMSQIDLYLKPILPGNENESHSFQNSSLDIFVELHQRTRKNAQSSNAGVRRILDFMFNLIVLSSSDLAIIQST